MLVLSESFAIFSFDNNNELKLSNISYTLKDILYSEDTFSLEISLGSIIPLLSSIKPFGKKRMDARSYINGIHDNNLIGKVLK